MLSETSQTQKDKCCLISLVSKTLNLDVESGMAVSRDYSQDANVCEEMLARGHHKYIPQSQLSSR